ncbi:hypothetical protein NP233_g3911 [Leucocoprinus birnbaumii]|uniref:Uncharacterized protein n=1 Tax=Leucocoprinus birnbaumii TaxID=56174 RepID=A0AAD5VZG5_9AGAR|nr:hypothetical protein NP233_g3911 [Leucocoprinus birnbaumii]
MPYRYSLLPTHSNAPDSPRPPKKIAPNFITNVFLSRRYARFSLLALISLACIAFVTPHESRPWLAKPDLWSQHFSGNTTSSGPSPRYPAPRDSPPENDTQPPLFERYSAYEDELPQHDDSLPFPEANRKFVYFADHVWGVGWGNAMQEMILNAQLAYESGRSFVFDDYTWNREETYSEYNGKLIPARVPLSALVAGPLAGQPFSNLTIARTHPRAVSKHYFDQVCPEPYLLDPRPILETLGKTASAVKIMSTFREKLQNLNDSCVEIQKDTTQVFDYWLMGSTRLHDIVPSLIDSPITRDFSWSPLINYAFQKNEHHFTSSKKASLISILFPYFAPKESSISHALGFDMAPTPSASESQSLPLLAMHLRRGDFIEHCDKLNDWNSTYTGFNTQPSLPDRFFMENDTLLDSMSPDEKKDAYKKKCFIDVDEVRKRVVRAVKEWRTDRLNAEHELHGSGLIGWWRRRGQEGRVKKMLRKVYIMTNGDREFLDELKAGLIADAQRSVLRSGSKFKLEDEFAQSSVSSSSSASEEYDFDFAWSWDEVSTSRDLDIGWETKYVAQAMDMYVGQRAEVFVGNGFSSLTGMVVLLRNVAGVEPWRTRFW